MPRKNTSSGCRDMSVHAEKDTILKKWSDGSDAHQYRARVYSGTSEIGTLRVNAL